MSPRRVLSRASVPFSPDAASVWPGHFRARAPLGPGRERSVDSVAQRFSGREPFSKQLGQAELRRQISQAIWRALADPSFAQVLLANPAVALGAAHCTSHQRWQLQTIRAPTIRDFAEQSEALFWDDRSPIRPAWFHLARAVGQ